MLSGGGKPSKKSYSKVPTSEPDAIGEEGDWVEPEAPASGAPAPAAAAAAAAGSGSGLASAAASAAVGGCLSGCLSTVMACASIKSSRHPCAFRSAPPPPCGLVR